MPDAATLNRPADHEDDRVRANTARAVNAEIDRATNRNLRFWSTQPRDAIDARITALDREWDIERYLEMTASSLALSGVIAGLAGRRKALILPVIVLSFLFQHAVHGWCPPLTVFRRFGIRTRKEIDREKYALVAMRAERPEV